MFRPEHEAAIRIQMQSLAAMCGLPDDAPEVLKLLSETMSEQKRILEEIRIEIHNQLLEAKRDRGKSLGVVPVLGREVFENDRVTRADLDRMNGILR